MKKIDAVQTVRKIRDKQKLETTGKTTQEIIAYYREKAHKLSQQNNPVPSKL